MVKDLLMREKRRFCAISGRARTNYVPTVKDAFVIVRPGGEIEFDVFEDIIVIKSGFDVFKSDCSPVGAAFAETVT